MVAIPQLTCYTLYLMLRRVEHIRILLAALAVLFLFSCGNANLELNDVKPFDLVENSSQAIWHDGNQILSVNARSNDKSAVFVEPLLMLENGSYYGNVLVAKPNKDALAVYGIYQIDIPDADRITFRAKVGYSYEENPASGNLVFRLSVQEGNEFPALAEIETPYDGTLKTFETDLSPYRGRFKFLILSVEVKGDNPAPEGIWLAPKISYEFY